MIKYIVQSIKIIKKKGFYWWWNYVSTERKFKLVHNPKVRSYYPENYPIDSDPDKRFAYFAENTDLIPLKK